MSLPEPTLERLRAVLAAAERTGHSPLAALADVQRGLPPGTEVTIDFGATETLGHPLLVVDHTAAPLPSWWRALSPREQEVALLLARGLANQAIAAQLCIAVSTVKDHVHHILDKAGLRRRTEVQQALSAVRVTAHDALSGHS